MTKKKDNSKKTVPHRHGRAPMMINDEGEVVFAPRHDCEGRGDKERKGNRPHKPTPLMMCNEISKMFANTVRESNDDQRIQGSYRDILFHLAREDGKSQLDLAHLTHLKPPTISVALNKLENEGYVRRESDPMDARRSRVYLTEKGRAIDEKAKSAIVILDEKAAKGFSEEEYKQLMVLLFKLRENIAEKESEKQN